MNKVEFVQAKKFIYSDVQREICLAKSTQNPFKKFILNRLIGNTGGGNFMAAQALLSYTEFAGKLKFDHRKNNGDSYASKNFNDFFDIIGKPYKEFRSEHNVYDVFRCGLVHEYYTKKNCTIYMMGQTNCGIGKESDETYFFVVERYFIDFKNAFNQLEMDLYGDSV